MNIKELIESFGWENLPYDTEVVIRVNGVSASISSTGQLTIDGNTVFTIIGN